MALTAIAHHRLVNQQIAYTKFSKPQEIVSWMIAMQAQEFAMAKWAIGLRLPGSTESKVEKAFNDGSILRTHAVRPTWHFVTPADIHWILSVTAPRIHQANAYMYKQSELDSKTFKRSNDVLTKALEGRNYLTRDALKSALAEKKILAEGFRLSYIMMHAELEGVICSGPRQGKQFTYALMDERAPQAKKMDRDEALAEFTRRYFTSRGPATLKDFAYWSGLTLKEANEGLSIVKSNFITENFDGEDYILAPSHFSNTKEIQSSFLMPDYDEYGMSYKNRSALSSENVKNIFVADKNASYYHWVVVDGVITGSWKPVAGKGRVEVKITTFGKSSKKQEQEIKTAVKKYTAFMRAPI